MNFTKNFVLFFALFIGGIVMLNFAGVLTVNLPNGQVESGTGETTGNTVEVVTVSNIQSQQIPSCDDDDLATLDQGKIECKSLAPLANVDCIDPSGVSVKEGAIVKLAKAEVGKCREANFICSNGKLQYQGTETATSPKLEDYKSTAKDCKALTDGGVACKAPWRTSSDPEMINDGEEVLAFRNNIVAKDGDCEFEKVACVGGELKQKFGFNQKSCVHSNIFSFQYIKENLTSLMDATATTNAAGAIILKANVVDDATQDGSSCTWFGKTIKAGESVYAFKEPLVSFENQCSYEIKVCRNGSFSLPNKGYAYEQCVIGDGASCTVGKTTLDHAEAKMFYAAYDSKTKDCASQLRRCRNGSVDGGDEYINTKCTKTNTVPTSPYRCPSPYYGDNQIYDNGWVGVGYYRNSVGRLGNCEGEVEGRVNKVEIRCEYGSIQPIGNVVKLYKSCVKGVPKDCKTPWGATVKNGETVRAFADSNVSFGGQCLSETRVCNDGVLGGSFQYDRCSQAEAISCTAPRGAVVGHSQSIIAYQNELVSFGTNCASQTRVCNNGNLGGTYVFKSCVQEAPKNCNYNGNIVIHGATIVRYKDQYVEGAVADGSDACVRYTATCNNGSLQGSLLSQPNARFTSCTASVPN